LPSVSTISVILSNCSDGVVFPLLSIYFTYIRGWMYIIIGSHSVRLKVSFYL